MPDEMATQDPEATQASLKTVAADLQREAPPTLEDQLAALQAEVATLLAERAATPAGKPVVVNLKPDAWDDQGRLISHGDFTDTR